MINLIVYLPKEHNPVVLVEDLLAQKLIANGSIDQQNNSFAMNDGKLNKQVNFVVTMQTQSLLFNEIAQLIEERYGAEIAMYANPIVASNDYFDGMIRGKTKQIIKEIEE